ncbi:MAG: DUF1800 family protein [Bacteroidota bacterium]
MIPDQEIEIPISLSLTPYTGVWTGAEAAHLLRRTLFGPTFQQINEAVTNGMNETVAQLLTIPIYNPPLTVSVNESVSPFGTTWVDSVYPTDLIQRQNTENARRDSLGAWQFELINKQGLSIHQKMCLFWQNHFAAESTFDSRATYDYHMLIYSQSLGNFKQLVKDITINPSILVFLNGAQNNVFSPNENYARELLELYTIGKGPQIGEGDYTNYTEQDVQAGAKILTGWTIQNFLSDTVTDASSYFEPILHDTTDKTLSAHFGNAVVSNANENEYSNYIDIIFQQEECAKFICRKLYRWFVNYDLTPDVETTIINDMATTLISNNYEISLVIEELLKSEHFYDISVRGSIIKNPIEYLFSFLNSTHSKPLFDISTNYQMYLQTYWLCGSLGMSYHQPPNVGGWYAYYQAPNYSKLWINSSYIKLRFDASSYLTIWGGIDVNGNKLAVNHLIFLDGLSVPSDPVQVIEDLTIVFCPKGLTVLEKATLKTILTNGLPDFEWTVQYGEYASDPTNPLVATPVRQRIALTLDSLFKLPEFQTI